MDTSIPQAVLRSIDPRTCATLMEAQADTASQIRVKVANARTAFDHWRQVPLSSRLAIIKRIHDRLALDAEGVAKVLSTETGRPLQESLGAEVLPTLKGLEFLCRQAPCVLKTQRLCGSKAKSFAEPYGVIGVIGTWNYPLFLNLITLCQALASGNTVVWKPSELALASAVRIKELLTAAEMPVGVLEIIVGDAEAGRLLVRGDCDKYVFTGSLRTGRDILRELSSSGKPAVMELSGNDAFIVCHDTPLELAARSAVWGRISNAGQSCIAPQRFYVARAVYGAFVRHVKENLECLQEHERTPLRTAVARERCHHLVRKAIEQGACLMHGGCYDSKAPGFFYEPTLLTECDDTMEVMAEDLFGPVISVCPVADEDEAVSRANANPLALGASVWTCDLQLGSSLANRLRVGLVSVNDILLDGARPEIPFGGMRGSGFGKQRGSQGLEEFVVQKVISLHLPDGARRHLFPYIAETVEILRIMAQMRLPDGWKAWPSLVSAALRWQRRSRHQQADFSADFNEAKQCK